MNSVPHSIYPPGYHCDPKQPLPFLGSASQKNYMSVYIICEYLSDDEASWFRAEWAKTGKKLDMGKCCIRFKGLEDLALDVVHKAIQRTPADKLIDFFESAIRNSRKKSTTKSKLAKKSAANKKPSDEAWPPSSVILKSHDNGR